MQKLINLLFAAILSIGAMVSCNDGEEENPKQGELTLSVNKSTIIANETDAVTFTVKFDGETITSGYTISLDGIEITDNIFSTSETGTYTFIAEYDGITSNEVTVTATTPEEEEPVAFDATKQLHKNVTYFIFTATWCPPCWA